MSRFALRHMATVCGCVFASVLMVTPAESAIVFGEGTLGGVDNVHFAIDQNGETLTGILQGSGHEVLFSQPVSPVNIRTDGLGQATIVPVTPTTTPVNPGEGNLTSLRVQLSNGDLFSRIEINPDFISQGVAFNVVTDDGSNWLFESQGNSRFHAFGTNGSAIRYIDLIGPTYSITTIRQIRIGGITPAAVPEPSTWVMLTMGLTIVFGISRRKRASQQLAADGLA